MKKIWCLTLALCMLLGVGMTATAENAELDPVDLIVWLAGPGPQKDSDLVYGAFNEQLKDYLPNTTCSFLCIPYGDYGEKWSKAMAAGEQIDVSWFGWTSGDLMNEINMGALTPLDDLLAEYGKDTIASLGENLLNSYKKGGVLYNIPCWQGSYGGLEGIQFSKAAIDAMENKNYIAELTQLIDELNDVTDPIANANMWYDKLEEFLASAQETDTLGLGFFEAPLDSNRQTVPITNQWAYLTWGDPNFELTFKYISDNAEFEYELNRSARLNAWFKKGYIREDWLSCDMDVNFGDSGDPATTWVWDLGTLKAYREPYYTAEEANEILNNLNITNGVGIPSVRVETRSTPSLTNSTATTTVIPYTAANPERAMMYINLLNSPKGAPVFQTLVYGIEGTHWTRNDDGTITLAENCGTESTNLYGQNNWSIGNCRNSLPTSADLIGYYDRVAEIDAQGYMPVEYSFAFDPYNVEMQLVNVSAAKKEYDYAWVYDDYEERIRARNDKLMAAGYADVVAEIQAQWDAYVESALVGYTWVDFD